jgi:beta-lactamase superfamily II metal-dependent hydrolase
MQDFNNTSTVLMMTAEGSKVLFPGDASAESDKVILRRYADYLKCDVVQVSHHGHSGTSPEFYRLADAECALFAVTQIKFDEEYPRQEANRTAIEIAKEYYIASNGTVEIPLPYVFGQTKVYPDETFEDFNGIFNLWTYEYTDEMKQKLYNEFLLRSKK